MRRKLGRPNGTGKKFDVALWLKNRKLADRGTGRCSAITAERLKRIRDERLYLSVSADWLSFCNDHLLLSRSSANRVISTYEKYGANYFRLAQIMRITPAVYRLVEPFVSDEGLRFGKKTLALTRTNRVRIATAVQDLADSRSVTDLRPKCPQDRLLLLERFCSRIVPEVRSLWRRQEHRAALVQTLTRLHDRVARLTLEIAPVTNQ
jgi:hypothetical protein